MLLQGTLLRAFHQVLDVAAPMSAAASEFVKNLENHCNGASPDPPFRPILIISVMALSFGFLLPSLPTPLRRKLFVAGVEVSFIFIMLCLALSLGPSSPWDAHHFLPCAVRVAGQSIRTRLSTLLPADLLQIPPDWKMHSMAYFEQFPGSREVMEISHWIKSGEASKEALQFYSSFPRFLIARVLNPAAGSVFEAYGAAVKWILKTYNAIDDWWFYNGYEFLTTYIYNLTTHILRSLLDKAIEEVSTAALAGIVLAVVTVACNNGLATLYFILGAPVVIIVGWIGLHILGYFLLGLSFVLTFGGLWAIIRLPWHGDQEPTLEQHRAAEKRREPDRDFNVVCCLAHERDRRLEEEKRRKECEEELEIQSREKDCPGPFLTDLEWDEIRLEIRRQEARREFLRMNPGATYFS